MAKDILRSVHSIWLDYQFENKSGRLEKLFDVRGHQMFQLQQVQK